MATTRFNPSASHPARAVQAWQILVGRAMNRQTVTYLGLSQLMYGKSAPGVLDKILGHIAFFCKEEKLPPLTSVVVNKSIGVPGHAIPVEASKVDELREQVYEFDWHDVYPPSADELKAAYDRA